MLLDAYGLHRLASQARIMCKYTWILGQSTLCFTIGSGSDRSAFKAPPLGLRKAMSVFAHYDDLQSCAQLEISILD
jgi:hypothetical protein